MDNAVKILRLNDGEDIITSYQVDETSKTIVMHNPMTLFFKRLSEGKSIVMLSPWLPLELVDNNTAKIECHQVLSIVDPKKTLIEYYNNSVNESIELMNKFEEAIDQGLMSDETTTMLDESDFDDETIHVSDTDEEDQYIEQMLSNTNKKYLH